ncbi:MAG: T9SS type A sorting domain-containing protein [Bacteroidales bacterium]
MTYFYRLKQVALIIALIIGLTSTETFAQANYSGGQGGGYAATSTNPNTFVNPNDTILNKMFEADIYPNPLKSNDKLKAKLSNFEPTKRVSVIITDIIGSKLLVKEIEASEEITINFPHDRLSKGIYLVTFKHNNNKVSRRLSYAE